MAVSRFVTDIASPLWGIGALHSLKELTLSGLRYDESVPHVMGKVEMLDLSGWDGWDLLQCLEPCIKLKQLILSPLWVKLGLVNPEPQV